jgi:hypothetical protein
METLILFLAMLLGGAGGGMHTMDADEYSGSGGSGDTGGCIVQQGCGTGGG